MWAYDDPENMGQERNPNPGRFITCDSCEFTRSSGAVLREWRFEERVWRFYRRCPVCGTRIPATEAEYNAWHAALPRKDDDAWADHHENEDRRHAALNGTL
jgi:hypothetical protein